MHPFWIVCLIVRVSLIYFILFLHKENDVIAKAILFIIGSGFLYKGLTGSNKEYQLNKVFWHDARVMHSLFYFAAFFYLMQKNIKMTGLILSLDIVYSLGYRYLFKK